MITTLGHLARPKFHRLDRCETFRVASRWERIIAKQNPGRAKLPTLRTGTRIVPKCSGNLNETTPPARVGTESARSMPSHSRSALPPHSTLTMPCHQFSVSTQPFS
ncbi:hypothetical protein M758_10G181300 [Ceratodon purpureus]|uniref:Uncharacterized protein n=1 Tax=Ceratodon purpureus TaxID=3225 RepID=A0A8T0GNB1_CERPU|nr:hypothetical protein KC19_10G185600 [Ceratodon purpureus]KAG0560510.1 hypothetical protein KC19_10G185800 [Ceratodon purpureus]KAG0604575.1 hypothetical protein M758_10G181100 [Ceratodon purpureus]KAG0604577.1 hypothetical protein M758_10G181300 [Ceratodon purpureus]